MRALLADSPTVLLGIGVLSIQLAPNAPLEEPSMNIRPRRKGRGLLDYSDQYDRASDPESLPSYSGGDEVYVGGQGSCPNSYKLVLNGADVPVSRQSY